MTLKAAKSLRPNIVLMVADDHGREALGCYGNPVVHTPNLDALAAEGVLFTRSFATCATCAASRSVIMTGLHNHANGTYGHTHAYHHFSCFDNVQTLPALLKKAGYRTGRVGKTHWAPEHLFPFDWGHKPGAFGRNDVAMSESCREFVGGTEPFFLYWASHNPHRSGIVKEHPLQIDAFGNPAKPFPGDEEHPFTPEEVVVPPFLPDTPEVRAELAQYYQSISRLDRGVGRLMQVLKSAGCYENTVVIYISDNGAAFPEAKTTLYDPGMRLPCIIRTPKESKVNATCGGLLTWADLTPTILDFADVPYERDQFHGQSAKGIIDQENPSNWRDEIYASHTFHEITNYYPMRVIRTRQYKFIWNIAWKLDYSFASDLWRSASWQGALRDNMTSFGVRSVDAYIHRPKFELYDLEADPHEIDNLAERPEYHSTIDSFVEKIKDFQKQTGDPWMHKWTYE